MPQNGEMLTELHGRIEAALSKKLPAKDKDFYEILDIFVIYLMSDHPKVQRMYRTYVPMAWGFAIAAATFIGLLASGRVDINIR